MLEEEFKADNPNIKNEKSESENQVDKFSQTTKLLDKELKDKKENISKVLEEGNLKEIFENLLSSEDGELCIMSLLECENNEEEIKKVILANLPEGYAYNVSTNEVVKTEKKNANDYTGATTLDQKTEQADQKTEQADQKTEQADQKTEQADQKIEQADQKTEQADQKTEQADQKTEQADQKIENLDSENRMKQAIEERDRLVAKYQEQNLDVKTNQYSEKYQEVKTKLENNGTLNQLRQDHDEQFINNYILVQTTLTELKSNPTNYEQSDISYFDKVVKNLNNSCNIPDTNLSSFSTENIAQTRTELFNSEVGNDSLISAKKSNMESHDYSEIFPEKIETDELIAKYGNFLEGNLKTFWQNYKNNPNEIKNKVNKIKDNPNSTNEDKIFLQNYNNMIAELEKKRKETEEQTKNMMEELCIISQIKGMYMCMGEGTDFNLNKAREIESENGILTLRGHIDGVDFAIRQDTNNPEAKLQTSTKLAKERNNKDDTNKSENFIIGGKDNFVDSNFILPSQEEIFESIKGTIKSDELFKISDNSEEYLKNLQTNIMGKLEEKYEKTKYAQHYMKEQVKGEKIIDKTISFIEKIKDSELDAEVNNSKTQLYDFLNLMDFNVRYSTSAEKDKFYRVMDRVDRMLEQAKDDPTDGELRDHNDKFGQYLTGNTFLNTRNVLNNKMVGGESAKYAFDLFKNYKIEGDERKNGELFMINFDKMLNDLNEVEQDKKDAESLANIESNLYGAYGDLTLSYA